ncbi:hypothetical protein SAMN05216412_101191 [Nitrosospira multiformis]|uniref:Uncharacterized protein n=1 Tax=Nitrosospira multiformis TaxID=1231 RepID=A0A1H9YGB4_9PROT|nr:hypothetical protein [Nitrosospira multiformis]SES67507.1 hypothetical protein SAMN05216412_101191 [Nitrosospira multiformis]
MREPQRKMAMGVNLAAFSLHKLIIIARNVGMEFVKMPQAELAPGVDYLA